MAVNVLSFFYTMSLVVSVLTYTYLFVQYTTSKRNKTINPPPPPRMRKMGEQRDPATVITSDDKRKRKVGEQRDPATFLSFEDTDSLRQNIQEQQDSTRRSSQRSSLRRISIAAVEQTSWVVRSFSTTKFYIPLLLIFTYLVLTVIPSITRSFRYLLGYQVPYEWNFFYLCSVRLSYTVDGIIYVFCQKKVRRLLWRFVVCRERDDHGRTGSTNSSRTAMLYS